jgi:hypothetical protein
MVFTNAVNHILPGDQVKVAGSSTAYFLGTVRSIIGTTVSIRVHPTGVVGSGTFINWDVTNLSSTGISFCNVTPGVATAGHGDGGPRQ